MEAVLVFPIDKVKKKIWLAKKVGKVGSGRLNGYGGKMEVGENPISATCREFKEETAGAEVRPNDLLYVARGIFNNQEQDGTTSAWKVHILLALAWFGKIRPTSTMTNPKQYSWSDIPKFPPELLLPGDKEWLPKILSSIEYYSVYPMSIQATYGPGQRELVGKVKIGILAQ